MEASNHFYYNLRQRLGSGKLFILLAAIAAFFILFISVQFIYVFALLFALLFAVRGAIGRRCPHCDRPLKADAGERDEENVFTMYVIWRCPHDGYEEKEKIEGDAGLFGVK